MALNVKSIFYCKFSMNHELNQRIDVISFPVTQAYVTLIFESSHLSQLYVSRLTDLLAKYSNNQDPGRVINIASVAGFVTSADGGSLSAKGSGTWSCRSCSLFRPE